MSAAQTFTGTQSAEARIANRLGAQQIARSKLLILVAAMISFVLSVTLWFMGHETQGIFVGIWVPSILSFGSLMLAGESRGPRS